MYGNSISKILFDKKSLILKYVVVLKHLFVTILSKFYVHKDGNLRDSQINKFNTQHIYIQFTD